MAEPVGAELLVPLGIADARSGDMRSSAQFPDGGAFRIEIPSVEGLAPLAAVLEEAQRLEVPVHRVSQGSGVMMLLDTELSEMVSMCASSGVELCLFLGPRGSWDVGAGRFTTGGNLGARARGLDQLAQCVADAYRAIEFGVRCLLVADEGVLWALHQLRASGQIPHDVMLKMSALSAPANPMSFRVVEQLGADSINIPSDLSVAQIAELRTGGGAAIDMYIESPDNLGGIVRLYDARAIVEVAAPVYLKFGLRNAPDIYPIGQHLQTAAVASARERVRRAALCLALMRRHGEMPQMSPLAARDVGPLQRFTQSAVAGGRP